MMAEHMATIAEFINRVLSDVANSETQKQVEKDVADFCSAFALYGQNA